MREAIIMEEVVMRELLTVKVSCYKRRTATFSEGKQLEGKVINYKGRRDIMREGVEL